MLSSIANGPSIINNAHVGKDCLATIQCLKAMGVKIERYNDKVIIHGKGLYGLNSPFDLLDAENSATTVRILSGILSAQNFPSVIFGDTSLAKRPMKRIIDPLTSMGAKINSTYNNDCIPLEISPSRLRGIDYRTPILSAQIKSALLFAGLYADGPTSYTEEYQTRNHTELLMKNFGIDISVEPGERVAVGMVPNASDSDMENGLIGSTIGEHLFYKNVTTTLYPKGEFNGRNIQIPGDMSAAAFVIGAALLIPNSAVKILNVGVNETRDGLLRVLQSMGADITMLNYREHEGESMADLLVRTSELCATTIEGPFIPNIIDEIPMLAVIASLAKGTTIIKDAKELRYKESDRITSTVTNLRSMGVNATETEDGMIIEGTDHLEGAIVGSFMDHRIAMAFSIAGLVAKGETRILNSHCVDISYPNFYDTFMFE
jgi:3-phosphoshikimate 1-carboxyvinyltransferase